MMPRIDNHFGMPCSPSNDALANNAPPPNNVSHADQEIAGWKWVIRASGVARPWEKNVLPITANAQAASTWRGAASGPNEDASKIETTAAENVVKVTM